MNPGHRLVKQQTTRCCDYFIGQSQYVVYWPTLYGLLLGLFPAGQGHSGAPGAPARLEGGGLAGNLPKDAENSRLEMPAERYPDEEQDHIRAGPTDV